MITEKHFILTRCKFQKEEDFFTYFDYMKKTYIPSINSQTDKNFSIALVTNPQHYNYIRELIDPSIEIKIFESKRDDYTDYVIKNNINIQTRHDCDDIMIPTYIERIHKLYDENKEKYEDFILNFHPTKYILDTGDEYTHSRNYKKICSMFSTLIQKKVKYGVMDVVHDHLHMLFNNVIYIPETYVKLVIHGNNTFSKLLPNDKLIKNGNDK